MCVPSASTLHRHRFTLDCGLALMMRRFFDNSAANLLIYMLADSSPRAGLEWLFTEMYITTRAGARRFREAQNERLKMRRDGTWVDERGAELTKRMIDELYHHVCVPMGLGAKQLSPAAKFVVASLDVKVSAIVESLEVSPSFTSVAVIAIVGPVPS